MNKTKRSSFRFVALVLALIIALSSLGALTTQAAASPRDRYERFSVTTGNQTLWGMRDSNTGIVIIPPMYYGIHHFFSEGLVGVRTRNDEGQLLWGFVNASNVMVVPPRYHDARPFAYGRAAVAVDSGLTTGWWANLYWGFIDMAGNEIIPPSFSTVTNFSYGVAWFSEGVYNGLLDTQGNIVAPAIFFDNMEFQDGLAPVRTDRYNTHWGIINTSGEFVVPIGNYCMNDIIIIRALMNRPANQIPRNVEQLHWREVRNILPLRTSIRITDAMTGITFNVASMSNGNHADVETLTAADTARLNEAFGGHHTWNSRPVWVTVGNRTFSAAIHNMPHAQETIAGNNMDGHICLHFYGSTTHNTNLPVHHYTILQAQRIAELASVVVGVGGQPTPAPTPPPAATVTATPTASTVLVDGVPMAFQAFNIRGNNYFMLRDLAYVLNGTSATFSVDWDGQSIIIRTGMLYHPTGVEMRVEDTGPRTATPTSAAIMLDGRQISPTAYNIGGSNYFMLRDMAGYLGFEVDWDPVTGNIFINTNA